MEAKKIIRDDVALGKEENLKGPDLVTFMIGGKREWQ